jgi:DNA-binding response OmpR family regulator
MATILVIDDDEIVNGMLVQLLTEEGYAVRSAGNGRTGMALVETSPVDLIITDIVMPDKEGLETIIAIKKISKTIPIIAISGGGRNSADEYLHYAQHLGADYSFKKPIDSRLFLAAVRECLAGI